MGQHGQDELELELEYFERIPLTARLALLRLAGRWTGGASPGEATLVVEDGVTTHRIAPLAGKEPVAEGGGLWRAAFPVPLEVSEAREAEYVLDVGALVDLPPPTERALAAREPESVAAPATEPEITANGGPPDTGVEDDDDDEHEHEDAAGAPEPEPSSPADAPPPHPRPWEPIGGRSSTRWRLPVLAAAALLIIVGAGLLAVVLGSHGDSRSRSTSSSSSAAAPPSRPASPVALAPLPGGAPGARATLRRLPDGREELAASGLPAGRYEVWLYNSIVDSRPLGSFTGPAGKAAFRLDAATRSRYHFLDVSREGDANPNHSGRSVLRVDLKKGG